MPKTTSRFAGLVEGRKTPATSEPINADPEPRLTEETKRPPQTVDQEKPPAKLAKYKDPNRKGFSFLLNVGMHAKASFLLKTQRNQGDMSDLVERLLSEWVVKNEG